MLRRAAAAAGVLLAAVLAPAAYADGPGGGVCEGGDMVVTVCAEDGTPVIGSRLGVHGRVIDPTCRNARSDFRQQHSLAPGRVGDGSCTSWARAPIEPLPHQQGDMK